MKAPAARRPMSTEEREMAKHLARCSFVPGTAAKRFAREIGGLASTAEPAITERMAAYLRSLVYTFRRQVPRDVVVLAGDVPQQRRDFAAQQRWRDEQTAIAELITPASKYVTVPEPPAGPQLEMSL